MLLFQKELLFIILATSFSTLSFAAQETTIAQFRYYMRANSPYTTGLSRVDNAPSNLTTLKVYQAGNYCDVYINFVRYTTEGSSSLKTATLVKPGEYTISREKITAIQLDFEQRSWDGVECLLTVTLPESGNSGTETLLGIISYRGGFEPRATLELEQAITLRNFTIRIPRHCGLVDVNQAGTVTEGVFDAAVLSQSTENGYRFLVADGGQRTRTIQVTLNGSENSTCSIPVYSDLNP